MHKSIKLKILALLTILIFSSSSSAIEGIYIICFNTYITDTEIKVEVEINLTLPYTVYENNTKITNGTLVAYTVAKITTPRNTTPGIINYGFFINRTDIDFQEYFWVNFSYGNLPLVPEFNINENLGFAAVIVGFMIFVTVSKRKKKSKLNES